MCGICGKINFNKKPVQESEIQTMMQKMKHRGPDDDGFFIDNNAGFGFVRLSILDLSLKGHQPMFDDTGRYMIIHNGEVYNYIEIREELKKYGFSFRSNTDTEVILKSYIYWGKDCLHKFNGMWAFVIYDTLTKNIFGARDRFGVKPFYYLFDKNHFIFSSEIDAILKVSVDYSKNENAIYNFLLHNRTDYDESTFFKEIKKLRHGCYLFINENKLEINKWYELRTRISAVKPFSSVGEFKELLIDSVKLRLRSDVPIGLCLSGGLDSSTLVKIISDLFNIKTVKSFSAVYKEGQKGDEYKYIKLLNRPKEHTFFTELDEHDFVNDIEKLLEVHSEPFPGTAVYSQYKVMELAKGRVSVLLDGQGADEYLAGYHYFYGMYFKELIKTFRIYTYIKELLAYIRLHKNVKVLKTMMFYFLPEILQAKAENHHRGNIIMHDFIAKYSKKDIVMANLYNSENMLSSFINHFDYKLEHLLKWEDLNSMKFSIESRVPFLDFRLVERTLKSDNNLKIRNGFTKYILRESFKSILPNEITFRTDKIGFLNPRNDWFKTKAVIELFNSTFDNSMLCKEGIINKRAFNSMFSDFIKGRKDYSKEIWKVFILERWFKKYF